VARTAVNTISPLYPGSSPNYQPSFFPAFYPPVSSNSHSDSAGIAIGVGVSLGTFGLMIAITVLVVCCLSCQRMKERRRQRQFMAVGVPVNAYDPHSPIQGVPVRGIPVEAPYCPVQSPPPLVPQRGDLYDAGAGPHGERIIEHDGGISFPPYGNHHGDVTKGPPSTGHSGYR